MVQWHLAVLVLFLAGTLSGIHSNPDEVKWLPGLNFKINFRHYSGYLNAGNGAHLHYWLFESQRNPATDPVVFWFNGGPACSSLFGALLEQGPFRVNSDLSLKFNRFAWNAQANILFLESPAGVGYSYKDNGDYTTNDDLTARGNFAAIRSFFKKYPHWENNDFYITGESYAGVYVPMLTVLALDNHYPKNLKGFAIGNGKLDYDLDDDSYFHFLYHHAFINDNHWARMLDVCCPNRKNSRDCHFSTNNDPECEDLKFKAQSSLDGVDPYHIYKNCVRIPPESFKTTKDGLRLMERPKDECQKCTSVPEFDPRLKRFLDQEAVRQALHINPELNEWNGPCVDMNYTKQYRTMRSQLKHLVDSGLKALIYDGDFDTVCNYLGARWFVEKLGYKATTGYNRWKHNGKLAGWETKYGNLTFKIVLASGHMVPFDQPGPAKTLFEKFLNE